MAGDAPLIEAHGLVKRFGDVDALVGHQVGAAQLTGEGVATLVVDVTDDHPGALLDEASDRRQTDAAAASIRGVLADVHETSARARALSAAVEILLAVNDVEHSRQAGAIARKAFDAGADVGDLRARWPIRPSRCPRSASRSCFNLSWAVL